MFVGVRLAAMYVHISESDEFRPYRQRGLKWIVIAAVLLILFLLFGFIYFLFIKTL